MSHWMREVLVLMLLQMGLAFQLLYTAITTFMKVAILLTYIRKRPSDYILDQTTP
jgi:hypothetical protein